MYGLRKAVAGTTVRVQDPLFLNDFKVYKWTYCNAWQAVINVQILNYESSQRQYFLILHFYVFVEDHLNIYNPSLQPPDISSKNEPSTLIVKCYKPSKTVPYVQEVVTHFI